MRSVLRSGPAWLAVGLLLGLAVGYLWPQPAAQALATDRFENFAVCTAPLDSSTEAVWFLDFTTGSLKAAAMHPKTGTFLTAFYRDILGDFKLEGARTPRFLMVSGAGRLDRVGGRPAMANSFVYVVELTTGQLNAYSVPWDTTRNTNTAAVSAPIVLVSSAQVSQIVRRD